MFVSIKSVFQIEMRGGLQSSDIPPLEEVGGTVEKTHLSKQYELGKVSGSPILEVTIAGKAENTKGIAKTREIYIASGCLRSVIKQNDRSVQKINRYVPNVDLGSSGSDHLHNMNYYKKSTMYNNLTERGKESIPPGFPDFAMRYLAC